MIAHDEDRDDAVAVRRQRRQRRRSGRRRRARTARAGGRGSSPEVAAARQHAARRAADDEPEERGRAPTSCSTNVHHTKSLVGRPARRCSASTGGSARPSLSPDSRLSEWRMMRGTRGLVTTLEESTGSVGDSSAPTRNASVQVRSVSALRRRARRSRAVIGIATTSLRSGRCHARLQHLGLDLEPVAEEDHDRARRRRGRATKRRPRVDVEHAEAALRRARSPASTKTAVSDRNERRARPDSSAPADQQRAEDERRVVERRSWRRTRRHAR